MILFRRRLLFWLIKAYIKRWGKIIILSFIGGLAVFFALLSTSRTLIHFIPTEKKVVVGVVGAYRITTLPQEIARKISHGLTEIDKNGAVRPAAATSWKVEDNGKKYIFTLDTKKTFSDGKKLNANEVSYNFSDVTVEKPDKQTIAFTLKDEYSPFLVTVSQPFFRKGLVGLGEYKVRDIELNGDFIKSLTLLSSKNKFKTEKYIFYPSEEAVKVAFALGEITKASGLTDTSFRNVSFVSFPNVSISKKTDYAKLVSVFYNTKDSLLSDKKIRNGLTYAIPNNFHAGERTLVPFSQHSIYYSQESFVKREQDLEHARVLIDASLKDATSSAKATIRLMTLKKYRTVANEVKDAWKKVGIEIDIEEVERVPDTFQAYLGDFNLPKDPDQYILWHSRSDLNITKLNNQRIDKLLEDGRKITDMKERKDIYADFQKYLLDDSPASFLYFPYEYEIVKE